VRGFDVSDGALQLLQLPFDGIRQPRRFLQERQHGAFRQRSRGPLAEGDCVERRNLDCLSRDTGQRKGSRNHEANRSLLIERAREREQQVELAGVEPVRVVERQEQRFRAFRKSPRG
jgi:hypothetical protein